MAVTWTLKPYLYRRHYSTIVSHSPHVNHIITGLTMFGCSFISTCATQAKLAIWLKGSWFTNFVFLKCLRAIIRLNTLLNEWEHFCITSYCFSPTWRSKTPLADCNRVRFGQQINFWKPPSILSVWQPFVFLKSENRPMRSRVIFKANALPVSLANHNWELICSCVQTPLITEKVFLSLIRIIYMFKHLKKHFLPTTLNTEPSHI